MQSNPGSATVLSRLMTRLMSQSQTRRGAVAKAP
jgi:hypothetical protein